MFHKFENQIMVLNFGMKQVVFSFCKISHRSIFFPLGVNCRLQNGQSDWWIFIALGRSQATEVTFFDGISSDRWKCLKINWIAAIFTLSLKYSISRYKIIFKYNLQMNIRRVIHLTKSRWPNQDDRNQWTWPKN